jgi:hypothetical protein
MSLTMTQPSSQLEADPVQSAIHCSQQSDFVGTMLAAAYFWDFPPLPSFERTEDFCALLSTFTELPQLCESSQTLYLEPETYALAMSHPVLPRELKYRIESELSQGLTQSAILQHWLKRTGRDIPLGSAAAVVALQDAVIVASDAEWYEHDDSFITEIGLSILDPRSIPQPISSSPWSILSSMENHHVRIKPHAHLVNKDLCEGHPEAFQFGSTTFASVDEAKDMLRRMFTRRDQYGNLRPVIFMGHAVDNDYEMIKSRFGLEELATIVATIDTQVLAVEHGLVSPSRKMRLSTLLGEHGIEELYLHNAGNDIVCTMIAALLMLCPPPQAPLSNIHPNKLHYVDLKAQLRDAGKTAVKEGRSYGTTRFCENCDSHNHTAPFCRVSVFHCEHCAKDPLTRHMTYTHKTEKCVHVIKQAASLKQQSSSSVYGSGGAKRSSSPNAVPCEYCIESTDQRRYNNANAYSHKSGDCVWRR